MADLKAQLHALGVEAARAIEATHRQYRREIVPLNQSPIPYVAVRRGQPRS